MCLTVQNAIFTYKIKLSAVIVYEKDRDVFNAIKYFQTRRCQQQEINWKLFVFSSSIRSRIRPSRREPKRVQDWFIATPDP
jgi:hypothetical protein